MKPAFTYLLIVLLATSCQDKTGVQSSIIESTEIKPAPSKTNIAFARLLKKEKWHNTHLNDSSFSAKSQITEFYKTTNHPVWLNDNGLTEHGSVLMTMIDNSEGYALDSSFFDQAKIEVNLQGDINDLIKAELALTDQYFRLAGYFKSGAYQEKSFEKNFTLDSIKENLAKHLADAIANDRIAESLFYFEPSVPEYKHLRQALSVYTLSYPMTDEKMKVLSMKEDSAISYDQTKQALILYGYLDTINAENDSLLTEAIKLFQTHNGLNSDGKPGKYTAKALSKSNLSRYIQAKATLTKLRWNKHQDRQDYLYANIPSFTMKISEAGKYVQTHRSVVGKSWTKTPELSAELEYFIINPRWHVPNSISSTELLEKAKKDPTYLTRNGYRVSQGGTTVSDVKWEDVSSTDFNYKISQNSGRGNALGKIKFIFPNSHNVYFHDTPSRYLFKNDMRSYSHGCVRIENPLDLAKYLATKQELSVVADSVEAKVAQGFNRKISLQKNLQVYIEYYTAGTNQEGIIQFYPDIYQKDQSLIEAISKPQELYASKN